MRTLSIEKMENVEGGCTCEGFGICCTHLLVPELGIDLAVCYSCDGKLAYVEQW